MCTNFNGEGCYIGNISCSLQPFIFAKLAFDSGRWLEMIILYCWLKIIMLYCGRCSDQLCTDDFGGFVFAKVFHKSLIGGKINIPLFFFVKSSSFEESLVPDCQTVKPVLVEVIQNVKELLRDIRRSQQDNVNALEECLRRPNHPVEFPHHTAILV